MKLWDKGYQVDQWIENFTVGKDRDLDTHLARWDVLGSMAHAKMLHSISLLEENELDDLLNGLKEILASIESGNFEIKEGVEDVHSQVEVILTEKLGDTGKKIHSGRSRNDQVLLDMRMYLRNEIAELTNIIRDLFEALLTMAEKNKAHLMPGYTHMQVAMPSSFGLWFSAYAEALAEDLQLLLAAWNTCNFNPLGSAAGYGSSFPLDRKMTTELLGFEDLTYNSIAAQMGRGKSERTLSFAMASLASTLGKFAMDICLFNSQNFNFLKLPNELTTGSSIMPHKTNPDVFEIVRGKCSLIQSLPSTLSQLLGNLPSGYHRELQLLKEELIPRLQDLKSCLEITTYAVTKMEVTTDLLSDTRYDLLFTVEEVNRLVLDGVPFRDAYRIVGEKVEKGEFVADRELDHRHAGSIGNLSLDAIRQKMEKVVNGMNFSSVEEALGKLKNS